MRRLLLGVAVITSLATAGSGPALAAPPPPIWTWTGFYVGANVGYSWGNSDSTLTLSNAATGAVLNSANSNFDLNGIIGGGQLGYNWQRNNWIFGLEADIQGSGQKGSGNFVCPGGSAAAPPASLNSACSLGHIGDTAPFNVAALPVNSTLSQSLDWFGTVRGRFGSTITPTVFGYVTGGLAYGQVSTTDAISGTNLVGPQGTNTVAVVPVAASLSSTTTKFGWTLGLGLEGVITGNWTGKVEYLYVDLGNVSGSFVTPVVSPSGALVVSSYTSHITDNILRVGINYQFRP
jgi:outer membrane immunogenic protein